MAGAIDIDWTEFQAAAMRRDLDLGEYDALDPFELSKEMEIPILPANLIKGIPMEVHHQLFVVDSDFWSGATLELPDGHLCVILNHMHVRTRTNATLMEELAHVHLAHPPSLRIPVGGGSVVHTYDERREDEAFGVGAAALIPRPLLEWARKQRRSPQMVATMAGTSVALVEFRCQETGIDLAQPQLVVTRR